ncbi:MAG: hypothetical protein NZ529_10570 [Cytophagaceae bacterium]|nr:hypothetical protein [Cytophagaceae bacterium]MDW8457230.1 hypothetical protein [Cytophagaceae bacterium]
MQQLHFTREQVIQILEDYSIQTGMGLDVVFRHFPKEQARVAWQQFTEK